LQFYFEISYLLFVLSLSPPQYSCIQGVYVFIILYSESLSQDYVYSTAVLLLLVVGIVYAEFVILCLWLSLLVIAEVVPSLQILSTLMMEATHSS
jgi:predicted transporter